MSVQIIINGENAQESLLELSALAAGLGQASSAGQSAAVQAFTQVPAQQPSYYDQPVYTQPPVAQQQEPVQSVPVQPQTQPAPQQQVPVSSAPTYTIDQLGVAAGPLVDAGRGPELTAWLNQRGATTLMQLDKSLYGEFALFLRSLGAKI
ncbi:hypothetical protein J40TS1_00100 [Paenibacillus montaniterrae]|uniref:Uncharacterized protein n=1 Tax=Paenibacillus montaniterrae TaxID=429341 RepID=A0A919YI81_9BACL|nr:hypothetical protein [Paenibacillus montaniterrae]GIP14368.1 hypothetical protein J40TS1_00100 [Paenibacillus montaniterrae]